MNCTYILYIYSPLCPFCTFNSFSIQSILQEKQVLRFVRIIEALSAKGILRDLGLIPLLAGAVGEEDYAAQVGWLKFLQPVLGGVLGVFCRIFQDGVLEDGWKCEV